MGRHVNPRRTKSLAERFATKYVIDSTTGCWLWTAHVRTDGYATIAGKDGNPLFAHRVAYELFVGPIPKGFAIDHVRARGCLHRHCVNPEHLEAVTSAENNDRSSSVTSLNARKSFCKHEHPFDDENTYWNPDGLGRRCRTCMREDTRRRRAKARMAP